MVFKFLRRIMAPEPEAPKKCDLKISEIDEWLKDTVNSKWGSIELDDHIETIGKQAKLLRGKLKDLKTAKLKNEKIHPKELQIMRGNKNSFIKRYELFLDSIRRPGKSLEEAKDYIETMEKGLFNLNKTTKRSYFILQNFFADHIMEINKMLNVIAFQIKEIKKALDRTRLTSLDVLHEKKDRYLNSKDAKKDAKGRIDKLKKRITAHKSNIEAKKTQIDKVKNSDDYKQYLETKAEFKRLRERFTAKSNEFSTHFGPIRKVLLKYERIAMDNTDTISAYLKDPAAAIIKDRDLVIDKILTDVSGRLETMNLKDKIREKSGKAIKTINTKHHSDELRSLNKALSERKIDTAILDRLEGHRKELENMKDKRARLKGEAGKLKRFLEKESDEYKTELESELSRFVDMEVTLK